MFRHVLVPLDGSFLAEAALPAAAFVARSLGGEITLVHVIERDAPREIHGQPHLSDAAGADAYLASVAARQLRGIARVTRHVHEAAVSDVAASIVAHAGELGHDLVVMCSHGRGHALQRMVGSIAQRVIAGGRLPVLVIRPPPESETAASVCRSMLVPLDGDADHEQALRIAAALAGPWRATLYLMTAVPEAADLAGPMSLLRRFVPGTARGLLESSAQEAGDYLRELAGQLTAGGAAVEVRVARGDPARAIAAQARGLEDGWVVLASHGRSGLAAFWEGSVASRVAGLTRRPLLLIPVGHGAAGRAGAGEPDGGTPETV